MIPDEKSVINLNKDRSVINVLSVCAEISEAQENRSFQILFTSKLAAVDFKYKYLFFSL